MSNRRVNRGMLGMINQHLERRDTRRAPERTERKPNIIPTSTQTRAPPIKRRGRGFAGKQSLSVTFNNNSLTRTSSKTQSTRPRTTMSNALTITRTDQGRAVRPQILRRTIPNHTMNISPAPRTKTVVRKRLLDENAIQPQPAKKLRLATKSEVQKKKKTQQIRAQTKKDVANLQASLEPVQSPAPSPTHIPPGVVLARNFEKNVTPQMILVDFFNEDDYDIRNVRMHLEDNGVTTGSAELFFVSRDQAHDAISKYSGKLFGDRRIRLSMTDFLVTQSAKPKQPVEEHKKDVVSEKMEEDFVEEDEEMEHPEENEGGYENFTVHVDNDPYDEDEEEISPQAGRLSYVPPTNDDNIEFSVTLNVGQ